MGEVLSRPLSNAGLKLKTVLFPSRVPSKPSQTVYGFRMPEEYVRLFGRMGTDRGRNFCPYEIPGQASIVVLEDEGNFLGK